VARVCVQQVWHDGHILFLVHLKDRQ
jgi:hypothetical protein